MPRRIPGIHHVTAIASDPEGSLSYWVERLREHDVEIEGPAQRFEERVVAFADPDGLILELVADPEASVVTDWDEGPVPVEHTIRGLHGVTLTLEAHERTAELLTGTMAYEMTAELKELTRYSTAVDAPGRRIDIRCRPTAGPGRMGAGSIHHVAFRATDGPGFTADEDRDDLGRALRLPAWLEDRRCSLEAALPAIELP